jgi:hypothetical protein
MSNCVSDAQNEENQNGQATKSKNMDADLGIFVDIGGYLGIR